MEKDQTPSSIARGSFETLEREDPSVRKKKTVLIQPILDTNGSVTRVEAYDISDMQSQNSSALPKHISSLPPMPNNDPLKK